MYHDVAKRFFQQIVARARTAHLTSSEHFTVDGALIDAWASLKSFQAKDAVRKARNELKRTRKDQRNKPDGGDLNADIDFRGDVARTKRSNRAQQPHS